MEVCLAGTHAPVSFIKIVFSLALVLMSWWHVFVDLVDVSWDEDMAILFLHPLH